MTFFFGYIYQVQSIILKYKIVLYTKFQIENVGSTNFFLPKGKKFIFKKKLNQKGIDDSFCTLKKKTLSTYENEIWNSSREIENQGTSSACYNKFSYSWIKIHYT